MGTAQYLYLFMFVSYCNFTHGEMMSKNSENYGPFSVKWTDYGACKGPKTKNFANFTTYLLFENNEYKGVMNFSFMAPARLDEVKMTVYSIKENRKSLLWSYRVDKPCQHYAIADILEKKFQVQDCLFKKGENFWIINFTDCTYKYLGTSFFYGEFSFKLLVLSKNGNIACLFFNPVFMKKV